MDILTVLIQMDIHFVLIQMDIHSVLLFQVDNFTVLIPGGHLYCSYSGVDVLIVLIPVKHSYCPHSKWAVVPSPSSWTYKIEGATEKLKTIIGFLYRPRPIHTCRKRT
jgi:hypothetical protein